MEKVLAEALQRGVGYFWIVDDVAIGELQDDQARAGALGRNRDTLEIDLLHDEPALILNGSDDPLPIGVVGATEQTGVLVLDVRGRTMNMHIGGSRASVERYRAQTLIAHPGMMDIRSANVRSASGYFHGNALLTWAEFDAFERDVKLDRANRVKSATIHLKPTDDVEVKLTPSVSVRFSGRWSFRDDEDLRHVVETALEIEVGSKRFVPFRQLLLPLLRCQEFLSIAFGGFVTADGGRATCDGLEERGHMWNATLMPAMPGSHVPIAAKNQRPLFHLDDLGGMEAFVRWIRLCNKHPRAVSPIVNLFRRGAATEEVRLLELASAIEYWVAAHRRTSGWTQKGANHAEAVALHVGTAFQGWTADSAAWAELFWDNYTNLKHNPSFVPDGWEVKVLQEGAYLLLLSELLNRISGSKRPGTLLFGDYMHWQLRDWTRDVITARAGP